MSGWWVLWWANKYVCQGLLVCLGRTKSYDTWVKWLLGQQMLTSQQDCRAALESQYIICMLHCSSGNEETPCTCPAAMALVSVAPDVCALTPRAVPTPGSAGFSGAEIIGTADDQTRLGDARTAQLGQALAYPFNVLNPINPLTCAQVLFTQCSRTSSDLRAEHSWTACCRCPEHTQCAGYR